MVTPFFSNNTKSNILDVPDLKPILKPDIINQNTNKHTVTSIFTFETGALSSFEEQMFRSCKITELQGKHSAMTDAKQHHHHVR